MKNGVSTLDRYIFNRFHTKDLDNRKIQKMSAPIRPFKSRMYGYKNQPGYVVCLVKMHKGGIEPRVPSRGRTPSNINRKYTRGISALEIAQNKVRKKYPNLKVLGGYNLSENGQYKWFEIILKDPVLVV